MDGVVEWGTQVDEEEGNRLQRVRKEAEKASNQQCTSYDASSARHRSSTQKMENICIVVYGYVCLLWDGCNESLQPSSYRHH